MWMGINGDGVLFYYGEKVTQFSIDEGFDGLAVRSIVEAVEGFIWLIRPRGAYTYNCKTLLHISESDGLAGYSVNHILEANNSNVWFATFYNGVSRSDGKTFDNFTKDGVITGGEVWSLFKNKDSNICFLPRITVCTNMMAGRLQTTKKHKVLRRMLYNVYFRTAME
jgi:hypothetical protein